MKTRYVLAMLAIVAGLGVLLTGCGQSEQQAEASSCSSAAEGISVTGEGNGDEMECVVPCSGAEGSSEYVVTCEGHDGSSECTVTCEGAEGDMECTVTCEGTKGSTEFTITCDGKTVTCEHADGQKCTCAPATTSGCPSMAKMADAGGACPGLPEAGLYGGAARRPAVARVPRAAAPKVARGSTH